MIMFFLYLYLYTVFYNHYQFLMLKVIEKKQLKLESSLIQLYWRVSSNFSSQKKHYEIGLIVLYILCSCF